MSFDHLPSIQEKIWNLLHLGLTQARHPFHTPTLATISPTGPRVRTVVLRHADAVHGRLACHTDIRSPKITEIRQNPQVQWHFYAPEEKIQLRLSGLAQIHAQDSRAETGWQASSLSSRRCYLAPFAPGDVLPQPGSNLPKFVQGRVPTAQESELGWKIFAVVETDILQIDWLYLDSAGHRRAFFSRASLELKFSAHWLAP